MRRIVLLSFTPKTWSGGVNRWTNDFLSGFPDAVHYSYWDLPTAGVNDIHVPEYDKSKALSAYLRWSKKVTKEDIIIGDGFWAQGFEDFPFVISHSHGIWSHRLPWEKDLPPENPHLHNAQLTFRKKHLARGGRLTSVSEFISWSMKEQWGFESTVINNGIDTDKWQYVYNHDAKIETGYVIHGVNDKNNVNKGYAHIEACKKSMLQWDFLSLDEACKRYNLAPQEAFTHAEFTLIPSAHEANSYFCLESLACDTPVLAYDVGLPFLYRNTCDIGKVLDRKLLSPEFTAKNVKEVLDFYVFDYMRSKNYDLRPSYVAGLFSLENFHDEWRIYLDKEFPS